MPMELLRQYARDGSLPARLTDEADIDKLRVLAAAGMVQAVIPDEPGQPAHLVAITGLGRATLLAQTAREVIALRKTLLPGRPPASMIDC